MVKFKAGNNIFTIIFVAFVFDLGRPTLMKKGVALHQGKWVVTVWGDGECNLLFVELLLFFRQAMAAGRGVFRIFVVSSWHSRKITKKMFLGQPPAESKAKVAEQLPAQIKQLLISLVWSKSRTGVDRIIKGRDFFSCSCWNNDECVVILYFALWRTVAQYSGKVYQFGWFIW